MSAGGLLRLVAYGAQDVNFTHDNMMPFFQKTKLENWFDDDEPVEPLKHRLAIKLDHCSICCDDIKINDEIHTTVCSHTYHHQCLSKYIKHLNKSYYNCPLCRTEISLD